MRQRTRMIPPTWRLAWMTVLCLMGAAISARAETVRVLTSYPQEMMDLYEKAFTRAHPDIRVDFQWGHGADAQDILRRADQGGVDVWWAPASTTFPVLAREGALRPLGDLSRGIETRIGAMPLGDETGTYAPFEIAGYGFALRPDLLEQRHLKAPKVWSDLTDPAYAGLIMLPVPSTIGYAPAMIEIELQHLGWTDGWGEWAAIAANSVLLDSGGGIAMTNELGDGTAAIGLVMDFFAHFAKAEGKPIVFVYPPVTLVNPAHVAIAAKAPHAEAAHAFVHFVLSEEGQRLLFSPEAGRMPVRRSVYVQAPAGTPRPFDTITGGFTYDQRKARLREPVLKAMFDVYITQRHDRLKELFAAIRAAEVKGETGKAAQARAEALRPPIDEAQAADPALNAALAKPDSEEASVIRTAWTRAVTTSTERAFALLKE